MKVRTLALIVTLGLGLLAAPLPAEAQTASSRSATRALAAPSLQELRDLDWVKARKPPVPPRSWPSWYL
ncbi:MAG: hypothetical protein ACE5JN_12440 [Candidatus Methylomirabilia bacterium]